MYVFPNQEEIAQGIVKYKGLINPNDKDVIALLAREVAMGKVAERVLELLNHKPEEVVCEK
ncbi:MAG: hypothetical protein FWC23_05265 [Chitinispirillia bacterium]|nr:hypothetical protein [Chitinispirillia bacterium]MCL2268578.1 hypothetical protein [Chitinispirillia bacterium]